ncbi:hypothetical protein V8C86DRAFT_311491 [Haematococcus lacustris]
MWWAALSLAVAHLGICLTARYHLQPGCAAGICGCITPIIHCVHMVPNAARCFFGAAPLHGVVEITMLLGKCAQCGRNRAWYCMGLGCQRVCMQPATILPCIALQMTFGCAVLEDGLLGACLVA